MCIKIKIAHRAIFLLNNRSQSGLFLFEKESVMIKSNDNNRQYVDNKYSPVDLLCKNFLVPSCKNYSDRNCKKVTHNSCFNMRWSGPAKELTVVKQAFSYFFQKPVTTPANKLITITQSLNKFFHMSPKNKLIPLYPTLICYKKQNKKLHICAVFYF